MIAVLQRVRSAAVMVEERRIAAIGAGILALVAAVDGDGPDEVAYVADRLTHLRIFPDEAGRMNRSVGAAGGAVLVVSQFTLAADTRRGRRPSFSGAASPERARALLAELVARLAATPLPVQSGEFGAAMQVELVNDGPATFIVDSARRGREGGGPAGGAPEDAEAVR